MKLRLLYFLSCFVLVLGSCSSVDDQLDEATRLAHDIELINDYLVSNGLTAEKTASGLHYILHDVSSGVYPTTKDKVTVRYKGYLLDGTVFDEVAAPETITFKLTDVIEGWREGIPLLSKGTSGTFFIPSSLGYGPYSPTGVPSNSVLIFDVVLLDF